MKQHIKKIVLFSILVFATVFSSCEKDLYDEALQETPKGKINYVSIEDVPFLIPSVVNFNEDYKFLTSPDKTVNKEGLDLNLDLEHILEYIQANGLKTYSIAFKMDIENTDNMFFENLHIYQKDGEYKTAILKYDSLEDDKKFDVTTFNGKIECYTIEKELFAILEIENGQSKHIKYFQNFGCWELIIFSDYTYTINNIPGCVGSGSGTATGTNTSGTTTGTNTGNNTSNGTTGTIPSETGTVGTTTGNDPTLVDHTVVIVPNEPQWPEFTTQFQMAFLITQRLELDTEKRNWLRNQNNEATAEIYSYLWEILNDDDTNNNEDAINLANEIIDRMITNPTVFTSIKPFIIEKNIEVEALDDCTKEILNTMKNCTNNDIAEIIAKLDGSFSQSIYKTIIKNESYEPQTPARTERFNPNPLGSPLRFFYIIKFHPNHQNSTKLFKASILIHELIHAYFLSIVDDYATGNNPNAYDDFSILFEAYVTRTYPSASDAHHQQMALNYIEAISDALQVYQPGFSQEIYSDLAWGALRNTPIFNLNFPEGSIERDRINNRYNSEGNNQTFYGVQPLGNPCE